MYFRLALNSLCILTSLELQANPWPQHPERHHTPYIINIELSVFVSLFLSLPHAHTDTHHTHMHTYTNIQTHVYTGTHILHISRIKCIHTYITHTHSEKYLYIIYLSRNLCIQFYNEDNQLENGQGA